MLEVENRDDLFEEGFYYMPHFMNDKFIRKVERSIPSKRIYDDKK